jgi:hypothetical protein
MPKKIWEQVLLRSAVTLLGGTNLKFRREMVLFVSLVTEVSLNYPSLQLYAFCLAGVLWGAEERLPAYFSVNRSIRQCENETRRQTKVLGTALCFSIGCVKQHPNSVLPVSK